MKKLLLKTMLVVFVATSINPIKAESSFDYYFPKVVTGLFLFSAAAFGYYLFGTLSSTKDNQDKSTPSSSSAAEETAQKPVIPAVNAARADTQVPCNALRADINNNLSHSGVLPGRQQEHVIAAPKPDHGRERSANAFGTPSNSVILKRPQDEVVYKGPQSALWRITRQRLIELFSPEQQKQKQLIVVFQYEGTRKNTTVSLPDSPSLEGFKAFVYSGIASACNIDSRVLVMCEFQNESIGNPITTLEQLKQQKKVIIL